MLLAITLFAHAGEPAALPTPLAAVAAGTELEVEMPAVQIRATPAGLTPWRTLPDGMAAEMALAAHGVAVEDASVVRADVADGHARLSWTELASGEMKLRADKAASASVCTASIRGGIWSGSGSVAVYAPTGGREDAVTHDLGFLLVEDHPTVGALVALAPGDSVTVVNVRRKGELVHEWVEVDRASGSLSVDRRPGGERICYRAPD